MYGPLCSTHSQKFDKKFSNNLNFFIMHECFHHWPYKAHPDSVAGIQKGIRREKCKKLKIDKANRSERKKFKRKKEKEIRR